MFYINQFHLFIALKDIKKLLKGVLRGSKCLALFSLHIDVWYCWYKYMMLLPANLTAVIILNNDTDRCRENKELSISC